MAIESIDGATVERLKEFFFDCMLAGYLGKALRREVSGLPDHVMISFENDEFMFVDLYLKKLGIHKSYGSISMFIKQPGSPSPDTVWHMTYKGFCDRRVRPFLKNAMRQACERRIFNGGRGPSTLTDYPLTYHNSIGVHDSFRSFECVEEIQDRSAFHRDPYAYFPVVLGRHKCEGGLLVPVR